SDSLGAIEESIFCAANDLRARGRSQRCPRGLCCACRRDDLRDVRGRRRVDVVELFSVERALRRKGCRHGRAAYTRRELAREIVNARRARTIAICDRAFREL